MANRTKKGVQYMRELGKRGGSTTKQKHSPDYFKKIGKKGGAKTKRYWKLKKVSVQ